MPTPRHATIEPTTLRTNRLTLRAVAPADAQGLFEIHADPVAMRFWSTPAWTDRARADALIAADAAGLEAGTSIRFAILEHANPRMVGCCSLFRIDPAQGRAELGYILRRDDWGRGLMTEALGAVVDFAFDVLGLRRLEADVDPRNAASMRLLERLGFTREASMRERWWVDGEVSDSAIYGLLRSDRNATEARRACA